MAKRLKELLREKAAVLGATIHALEIMLESKLMHRRHRSICDDVFF
jgi:hypothetical protein